MPNPEPTSALIKKEDGLYYTGQQLQYRITGLQTYHLDRLRITLKASLISTSLNDRKKREKTNVGVFHIDTLDLYNSKARYIYNEDCKRLSV